VTDKRHGVALANEPTLNNLTRDILHGIRFLSRSPGFTVTAVLSMALGIGANTVSPPEFFGPTGRGAKDRNRDTACTRCAARRGCRVVAGNMALLVAAGVSHVLDKRPSSAISTAPRRPT